MILNSSEDVDDSRLDVPDLYQAFSRHLARVHSIPYDALPKRKSYLNNYGELGDTFVWAHIAHWNTMHVYALNFNIDIQFFESGKIFSKFL